MADPIRVFDKYEVVRRLGAGGMGDIFLARQRGVAGFDRLVVLKSLRPDIAGDEGFLAQFLNEARVAATINHPNVVVVYEVGEYRGVYFMAMEFIDGVDLSAVLRASALSSQRIPLRYSMGVVHDAALGLDHAHNAGNEAGRPLGIVHRDVSPHNVMVRLDGLVKVVDFGIAAVSTTVQPKNRIQGKLRYMSPEQVRAEILDGRSDQFALGIVLWEMLTQRRLFSGATPRQIMEKVLRSEIPPPSQLVPDISPALEGIVLKMLTKDRTKRFVSCREVALALRELIQKSGAPTDQLVSRYTSLLLGAQVRDRIKNLAPEAVTISGLLDKTDRHCLSCGHKNSIRDRFCAACGSSLYRGASDGEVSDSMTRSGSEYVAELDLEKLGSGIASSSILDEATALNSMLSGERRSVVCVTGCASGLADSRTRAGKSLVALEAAMLRALEEAGSTQKAVVTEASAASFCLVLGGHARGSGDPVDALRLARRLARELPEIAKKLGVELELGLAVASGEAEVRVGTGGRTELHGELLAEARTLAALVAEQFPSTVVVNERLADRVASFTKLDPLVLREGTDQTPELRAFVLGGPIDFGSRAHSSFLGRSVEQIRAGELMVSAVQGQPGAIVFTSEPGLGRTRLLHELGRKAVARGMAPIFVATDHSGDATDFARSLLKTALSAMVIKEEGAATPHFLEGLEWVQKVGGMPKSLLARLKQELSEGRELAGASREEAQQLTATLVRGLRALCALRPLCLLADDLHHLDAPKLAFLTNMVRRGTSGRVALFGAADAVDAARVLQELPAMELSPLTDAMLLAIAATVTSGRSLPKEAQQRVLEHAGGSPGFAMMLTQLLVDQGGLEELEESWHITQRFATIELPRRLENLVEARLDRLNPETRDFLRVSAVQGFQFSPTLSARALGHDQETARRIVVEAMKSRLVEPGAGSRAFIFAQGSVRKVLLSRFLGEDLRKTHRRLAEVLLEKARRDDVDAMLAITHHLLEARAGDIAARYAGHTAQLLPNGEKAASLYEAALEFLAHQPPTPSTSEEEAERHHRLVARAISCLAGRDLVRAEAVLDRVTGSLPASLDPIGRAECLRQRALVRLELGRMADARLDLDTAEQLLPDDGQERLRAQIWCDQATALEKAGQLAAAAAKLLSALGHAPPSDEGGQLWVQSNALGRVYFRMGETERAGALFEAAFEQARSAQSLDGQTKALTNLATVRATSGDGPSALAVLAQATALAERHADPIAQARIAHNRGLILLGLKDPIAARESILEASSIAREVGWSEGIAATAQTLNAHAMPPRS